MIVKPKVYQRDRTTIRMEPFVAVRGRLQKDGETTNVIAYEVTALRLRGVPTKEEELFPSLPGTQEWWPDRGRLEKKAPTETRATAGDRPPPPRPGPGDGGPAEVGEGERRIEEAQEEAAWERRRGKRQDEYGSVGPSAPSPALPRVREWWGKPEEARKSPFYYLTALRQAPPGTKSWG